DLVSQVVDQITAQQAVDLDADVDVVITDRPERYFAWLVVALATYLVAVWRLRTCPAAPPHPRPTARCPDDAPHAVARVGPGGRAGAAARAVRVAAAHLPRRAPPRLGAPHRDGGVRRRHRALPRDPEHRAGRAGLQRRAVLRRRPHWLDGGRGLQRQRATAARGLPRHGRAHAGAAGLALRDHLVRLPGDTTAAADHRRARGAVLGGHAASGDHRLLRRLLGGPAAGPAARDPHGRGRA